MPLFFFFLFFFFNDTATTEIYTLSLHDALPISSDVELVEKSWAQILVWQRLKSMIRKGQGYMEGSCQKGVTASRRSEEHTSELQSLAYLVCRLLLEKKKKKYYRYNCIECQKISR